MKNGADDGKRKYVDNLGIIEIRASSDDPEYYEDPIDMFNWQQTAKQPDLGFHEKFCQKNKSTTIQKFFHCIVCDCPLKSVVSLEHHVEGEKHVRKSLQKKRQEYGMPKDPPHQPQTKTKKKEIQRPRRELIRIPLMDRLREDSALGLPALGLQFVNEWINPRNPDAPRRYTCDLEGCKSAWGDSVDMYLHLVGKSMLHNKNYLIYHLGQEKVSHFKKDEVTAACNEQDKNERGFHLEKERDYSQIKRHMDLEMYTELVNRPLDWSEKKTKHGIQLKGDRKRMAHCNGSNSEPLGKRHRRSSSSSTFGGPDNPNNIPIGGNSSTPAQCNNFNFHPLSAEEQGKQVIQKLTTFCQKIQDCLRTGKGNHDRINSSIKSFHKLLTIFSRQAQSIMYKDDIGRFHTAHKRFIEMMTLEGGLCATLDTYERRLKKFREDVESSINANHGMFQDLKKQLEYSNYASELRQKVLQYSINQSNFSRQHKEEIQSKINKLIQGIDKLNNEIELVGLRMRSDNRNVKSPNSVISNTSTAVSPQTNVQFGDEKSRRLKANFHKQVLSEVKAKMLKYYQNTDGQVYMVKVATRQEFEGLCESVAQIISNKEIERWMAVPGLRLKDITLTTKMVENIQKYVDAKMKKRPALTDL